MHGRGVGLNTACIWLKRDNADFVSHIKVKEIICCMNIYNSFKRTTLMVTEHFLGLINNKYKRFYASV
jgi:hypothetical protein